jgi:hypothetical protein
VASQTVNNDLAAQAVPMAACLSLLQLLADKLDESRTLICDHGRLLRIILWGETGRERERRRERGRERERAQ